MSFDDQVARYQREINTPQTPPPRLPPIPPWHAPLLAAIQEARLPQVTLYERLPLIKKRFVDITPYQELGPGWVLHATVEYREGYLTRQSIALTTHHCGGTHYAQRPRNASSGRNYGGGAPPRDTRAKNLPRKGGWLITNPYPTYADNAAALIVAMLRSGKPLRRVEHGAHATL